MTTTTSTLNVHSVAADEGMLWSLSTSGPDPGILGSAAVAVYEPISPADHLTAELETWVDTSIDGDHRWSRLLAGVLDGLRVIGVDRVVTRAGATDGDRLRSLLAAGFRITGLEQEQLRLQLLTA
jgi:hypothetical protein